MLTNVIALYFISFFNSMASETGKFRELVLAMRYPITPFFYDYIHSSFVNTSSVQFANYMQNYREIFQANKWIIHGLRSYDSEGSLLTECVDSDGVKPRLYHGSLDSALKNELMAKWPRLSINWDEEDTWVQQYNEIGSCVTNNSESYFRKALQLFDIYNPGIILSNADMHPNQFYPYSRIAGAIISISHRRIYVDCLLNRTDASPALMEIQICFDAAHEKKNCGYRGRRFNLFQCPSKQNIYYPIAPERYL